MMYVLAKNTLSYLILNIRIHRDITCLPDVLFGGINNESRSGSFMHNV